MLKQQTNPNKQEKLLEEAMILHYFKSKSFSSLRPRSIWVNHVRVRVRVRAVSCLFRRAIEFHQIWGGLFLHGPVSPRSGEPGWSWALGAGLWRSLPSRVRGITGICDAGSICCRPAAPVRAVMSDC